MENRDGVDWCGVDGGRMNLGVAQMAVPVVATPVTVPVAVVRVS